MTLACKAPIDLEKPTALFPKDSHCEAQLRCSEKQLLWLAYLWFPNVVENGWKCEIEGIFGGDGPHGEMFVDSLADFF